MLQGCDLNSRYTRDMKNNMEARTYAHTHIVQQRQHIRPTQRRGAEYSAVPKTSPVWLEWCSTLSLSPPSGGAAAMGLDRW